MSRNSKPARKAFIETRARDELRQQAKYIEKRRKGHGVLLLNNVKAAIKDILNPDIQWGFYLDEVTIEMVNIDDEYLIKSYWFEM